MARFKCDDERYTAALEQDDANRRKERMNAEPPIFSNDGWFYTITMERVFHEPFRLQTGRAVAPVRHGKLPIIEWPNWDEMYTPVYN